MIGDPKRGYLLEIVLNKLLFLQEVQSLDLQIIALSATLPNIDEMIQYLHAQKYVATQRPNHLTEWIIVSISLQGIMYSVIIISMIIMVQRFLHINHSLLQQHQYFHSLLHYQLVFFY